MTRSARDEEFSAFVQARRVELLRSACLLTAGDTHQDFSVEETADLLNCSEGTVKSQTAKGVARLRELLAADNEDIKARSHQ
jgi:DNA-directed RNA polymerase specialized sigma24 family protein